MLIQEPGTSEISVAEETNKLHQPLLIILITLLILIIVSFLPADSKIAGLKVKSIDMISDIKPD